MRLNLLLVSFVLLMNVSGLMAQTAVHDATIIGPATDPHSSAVLDVKSTDKGVLVPNVNIADLATAAPVTGPAEGLLVYNTNITTGVGYYYWNGTGWVRLMSGNTTPLTGTGAADKVAFWTSATDLGQNNNFHWDNTNGRLGIGNTAPSQPLHVTGNARVTGNLVMANTTTITSGRIGRFANGTAAAPAYSFTNSTTTGMFLPVANELSFATSSSERIRIGVTGTVQLNAYTTNGIVRTTAGNGTLTSGGAIDLTTEVTGILPIANGGTGSSTQGWVDLTTAQTANGIKTWGSQANFSNVLRASNGTVALPTYSFTNSTGMGMWHAGTNILGFSTAGAERMRIGATGNVKINAQSTTIGGTNINNAWLTIGDDASNGVGIDNNEIYFKGIDGIFGVIGNYNLSVNVNGATRMTLLPTGVIRLNSYTTNGIVRTTAGNGTLTSGGAIDLTSEVTGILPIANGGTGSSTQGWVDLTTAQTAAGNKTWTGVATFSNTTPVRLANGTAPLPAVAFTSDPNTGIYSGGADILGLATAGAERMRIASNGNVGIGTAAPGLKLDVQTPGYGLPATTGSVQTFGGFRVSPPTSIGNVVLDMGTSGGTTGAWLQTTLRTDLSNGYPLLLNPNAGNVGIGTTTAPLQRLHVAGDINVNPGSGYRINNTAPSGQYLRGNGTRFVSSAIQLSDLPSSGQITVGTSGVGIGVTGSPVALGGTVTITSNATAANTASTIVARDASGNFSAGQVNANLNGQWLRIDDRVIEPNSITSGHARFGFTSYNNNNTAPYADFLHLRSYTDGTGGNDNLITLSKSGIAMRVWQQAWNSATPYATFKTVAFVEDIGNFSGLANPSATIGLTAVNGSATTAMRSDGAPALSQAIVPTWTGTHTFSNAQAIRMSNGTALLPALSFTGDPNTGMYWHSADAIGFATAGVEKMSIASNGDIELNNKIAFRSNDAWLRLNPTNAFTNGIYVANFVRVDGGIASGGVGTSGAGTIRATSFITSDVGFRISNAAANGTYLRGNGTNYVSSAILAADLPAGSNNYIRNQTAAAQATSNYWISGYGRANDFRSANGTAAAPAFRFASDLDNGMYLPTTNTLAFATTGAERMRIAANGNVGIGTAAPTSKLHVTDRVELSRMGMVGTYNSSQVQQIWSIGNGYNISTANNDFGATYGITYAYTNAGTTTAKKPIAGWGHQILFTSNGTRNAAISLTSGHAYFAGNVGIGNTAPSRKLHVVGDIYSTGQYYINNTSPTLYLQDTDHRSGMIHMNSNLMYFLNGSANNSTTWTQNGAYWPLTINMTNDVATFGGAAHFMEGNVGIGTATPTYNLHVNGRIRSNAINETSDARLKKNVTDLDNPLSKVLAMRGVNYFWRTDEFPDMKLDSTLQFGLIAQELEKVVPELVSTDSEGWKSIEYSHIVPLLIEAIKELKQENHELHSQLDRLVVKMDVMNSTLTELLTNSAKGLTTIETKSQFQQR